MGEYGNYPFGLRDVKLTNLAGTTQVDLPAGLVLRFTERVRTEEVPLENGDREVYTQLDAADWELEAGGISLEAYALMTGRTATVAGTTPTRTTTVAGNRGEQYPWFKIYGRSLGDGADDIHCRLARCKVARALQGEFGHGKFWISKCAGIAVDDGTNGVYVFVQHETGEALPAS